MNRLELTQRARSLVRDLGNSFFREDDVINYLNEGIERVGQRIPALRNMSLLQIATQEVDYMPKHWQHLLAVYCASRLCTHDERFYQAGTFMNEFETKIDELLADINNGDEVITDPDGNVVEIKPADAYVRNNYFFVKDGGVRDWTRYDGKPKVLEDPEDEGEVIM